ncbi:hypothetical protein FBU59_006122 [Linderina macrospora]|uniref:Uncharacterized protein n=1 Tax=Linderina macrospora TaxID=4868 RepID=A0ACC1J0N0_9FUNG|nr:hypothetical protein FBU59_006122 [Linderina macrospora]
MPVTSPRPYDAGFTNDIREVVKHVCDKSGPLVRIMAVGFSMGANVLTKYVGEEGTECLLSAAVAVCCPFDIKVAGEAINADNFLNNKVFLPQVVKSMKSCLKHAKTVKTAKAHPEWVNEIDDIMAATKPYQIEKQLITKINRCSSLDEYYSMASSTNYVDKIRIPYLAINSLDDRITPPEGIPVQKFKENRYLSLALVRHGGHLAFLTGTLSPKFWFIKPIQEFTSAMAKL